MRIELASCCCSQMTFYYWMNQRITWILKYHLVRKFPVIILVLLSLSHDKMFLDNVTNRTIEISLEKHMISISRTHNIRVASNSRKAIN
jgi:ATPase subunit of ABC transporter with duplicated ATPase domains